MNQSRLERVTVGLYILIFLFFALFLGYMFFYERNDIYAARSFESAYSIPSSAETTLSDPSAPVGIRRQFTWTLPECGAGEDCLAFYLVHHYVQVWFDEELVYALSPGTDNPIGGSPGSNWVMIPVSSSDSGRTVTVLATPVYQSVSDREITFTLGSHSALLIACLKADLPQILLSAMCVVMGIALIAAFFLLLFQKQVSDRELFYLGVFTLLIGIWRITDTRFSPILFSWNPMALGYITIGMLFLLVPSILLYMKVCYKSNEALFLYAALVTISAAAVVLICQVLGLAEFKQTLFIAHFAMIFALLVMALVNVQRIKQGLGLPGNWELLSMLAVSAAVDLANFYLRRRSSGVFFTILALVLYTIFRLVTGGVKANRKAYTDVRTGLFNKNRWDELMKLPKGKNDTIGIIMMDLNRLKYVNDTAGHEAGDKMIYNFAQHSAQHHPAKQYHLPLGWG